MIGDPQEVLDRFHGVLMEGLGPDNPRSTDGSITVADIYYDLAPFETCRDKLGVESVFDYERALLRLLAGQGGYVEIESLADRQKLEYQTRYGRVDPDVLRDFLSAGVRIKAPRGAAPVDDSRGASLDGEREGETEVKNKDLPPFLDCPACEEELPQQAPVNFCPFCGEDVRRVLCLSCEEKLRLQWRFCIACGTQVEKDEGTHRSH